MEFEVLHRSKRKQFLIAGVAVVLVLVAVVMGITFAKYRVSSSASLVYGEVNYSRADLNLVAVYLEREDEVGVYDNATDVPPAGEYLLNQEKSVCKVDDSEDKSITIQYVDGKLNFLGLTKRGTKCYAYFDKIRDTEVPVITNITSSVTQTSITVNVTATDNEGVAKYFYSINNGNYVESTSNSHTFNNLTAGTSYSIRIYVTDESGNKSTVETRNISTKSDSAKDVILAGRTVQTRSLPFTTSTKVEGTNGKGDIYQTTDWKGTTYYFAGNPSNNWVQFGGYYWRIIRINGDGSIRMIYQGTSANTTGTNTQIQTSKFNSDYDRSEYVGLKYTQNSQHGTNTKSTILTALDDWYTNTSGLTASQYSQYIDTNVGFCSDREMASGSSWSSEPSSTIYYAARGRLTQSSNNVRPSLDCSNSSDILKIPVGLITADEVVYGGLSWNGSTTNNYLYTGQSYWTMSPYYTDSSGYANVFDVYLTGFLYNNSVNNSRGVRPVINLKADTPLTGNGTTSNPYKII